MLANLIQTPCTIVRRFASIDDDDFSNERPTEDYVDTVCEIQQAQRTEPAGEGELSVTTWNVFLPSDVVAHNGDALVLDDGSEYELVGEPWRADSGSAAVHHVEATAKLTRGPELS